MALNTREGAGATMRAQLFAVLASLCSISSHAIVVARGGSAGRGCSPGQFPGPGSPPCANDYRDSGHLFPIKPLAINDGHTWPGCMCPIPMPGYIPTTITTTHRYIIVPPPAGEVEVLTVDVRMANKVRCANESIAEAIASQLRVPVKRITVTPWSWVLPDQLKGQPEQSTYLAAFIQEDHDRCGCEAEGGKMNQGQGFRKSTVATEGWRVQEDTSVMTVSQFQAIQAANDPAAAAAVAAGPGETTTTTTTLPSSRVQMLTRDPCLVYLLREMTAHFKKKVAQIIGVPEDKLIIDPPPVKGTVGLLQLDTKVNSEKKHRQVPVLGVRQCNLANQAEMVQRLSLLDTGTGSHKVDPAPAPSPLAAPAPANAPLFILAGANSTNGTNGTNATNSTPPQQVKLVMKLHNMDYDLLAASFPVVAAFTQLVKTAIGESGHIPPATIQMGLFPGSVIVEATITPPPDTPAPAIFAFLNGTVCNDTMNHLNNMSALESTLNGPLNCSVISLDIVDPPFDPPEENRAWIAFWSISILPPFDTRGAWSVLEMVNEPMTELSKLLPLTLARIPDRYRGLRDPNAAIDSANETRLPPPEDKAVGFALPNPYAEEAAIEFEMKRMAKENADRTLMVKEKSAMDNMKAQEMLRAAKAEQKALKDAEIKFTRAARVHAGTMKRSNATHGPDIVPFGVLGSPLLPDESPYPWWEQLPRPKYMLDLVQEPELKPQLKTAKRLRSQPRA